MDRPDSRLHICLGTGCNNNCLFCMEEDRESRARRLGRIDTATAKALMGEALGRGEIMFTAGEPTLRPDLLELIAEAARLGFGRIGLITNGRRFAYAGYLKGLLNAGLNYVLVSVHGHTARLHDGLTRTPGAFEQVVAGLENLRREGGHRRELRFVITCVLNRRNLPVLPELVAFFEDFGPHEIVFNAIQPLGRGDRFFDVLVPRYTEIREGFDSLVSKVGVSPLVRLLDVPACITHGLPSSLVGFVEEHEHFEPGGAVLDGTAKDGPGNVPGFDRVTRETLDAVLRSYGPLCDRCSARNRCEGVWQRYTRTYGFGEFLPLSEPEGAKDDG